MRFAVFTHVQHFKKGRQFHAYSPYVREMNLWFSELENIDVVAPLFEDFPNAISLPYQAKHLKLTKIPQFNLLSWKSKLLAIVKIPYIFYRVFQVMLRADHIHIRCPGNVGLIACIAQIFFPNKTKTAKYAGNWDPNAKQPWSYIVQKKLLSNPFLTRNIKVLVYGEWKNQTKNIHPFFTASFYNHEIPESSIRKPFLINFLFVGNLSKGKRPLKAIKIFENILNNGIVSTLDIYGNGVMETELKKYIKQKNLEPFIRLMGNQELSVLKKAYRNSHFLILPSISEGWPKVIAEAMFFGCIPVATNISCVSWMIGGDKRGILITDDIERASQKIIDLLSDKPLFDKMSKAAREWSHSYTLDRFELEIKKLL